MSGLATPKRIALYLPTLTPGGAERVMINLARGFVERGHAVDFVLAKAEGVYLDEVPPQVRLIDLNSPARLQTMRSLPRLVSYLRRERPDALLGAMNHANIVALAARRVAGVPTRVVVSIHNNISSEKARGANTRDKLLPWLCARSYPAAQGIVAVSGGVADDFSAATGMARDQIEVVYNPVITPELTALAAQPVGHPFFAPGQPPVILGAGRLEYQKNFPSLLRAFAQLRRERPARLVILGEGSEAASLAALALELGVEDDVWLPGHVKNPFAYMAKSAVFVLSSRYEGLPTVLIEALAVGTVVVSTDCPHGPAEIIAQTGSGRLVPLDDDAALAHGILAALNEPARPAANLHEFGMDYPPQRYLELLL
ncbi:glycosyltransferase [Deinococcus sp. KSM4-11]|uniref:glycosyltransferase n=1 Tax=Deinococcus sp. KSM4-11 TaxID=2568654 RepID=UPI00197AD79D|nr:glycosyltransferase [Deinococcus sp. KSM4-11]